MAIYCCPRTSALPRYVMWAWRASWATPPAQAPATMCRPPGHMLPPRSCCMRSKLSCSCTFDVTHGNSKDMSSLAVHESACLPVPWLSAQVSTCYYIRMMPQSHMVSDTVGVEQLHLSPPRPPGCPHRGGGGASPPPPPPPLCQVCQGLS